VFGGFVLQFVCDVIEGFFFPIEGEIWMGLLGFELLIHIFEKLD
jgi:hypothetical protein